jgi:hypothetical protein
MTQVATRIALALGLASIISPALAQNRPALRVCPTVVTSSAAIELTARVPANSIGCASAGVITANKVALYHCKGPEATDGAIGQNRLIIARQGKPTITLNAVNQSPALQAMSLYQIGASGDQAGSYVLALWEAQSNGMGINAWTVMVFDPAFRPLQTFTNVADFGPRNLVMGPTGCALGVTTFEDRGASGTNTGWRYKARFVSLTGGRVAPIASMPPRERRYTLAFERQRIATFDAHRGFPDYGDMVSWMNAAP